MRKLVFDLGLHSVGGDFGRRVRTVAVWMSEAAALRAATRNVAAALTGRAAAEGPPVVSRGARFCPPNAPRVVWEVRSRFLGLDEVPYAELFCISEPTLRKVVAEAALQDRRLFRPVMRDREAARQARRYGPTGHDRRA